MFRYREVQGIPVYSEETGKQIGTVAGLVAHPDSLQIQWLSLNSGGRYYGRHWISIEDVVKFTAQNVTIRSEECIKAPLQASDPETWIPMGRTIIGKPVVNEEGKALGRVEDYEFGSDPFPLIRFIVVPGQDVIGTRQQIEVSHTTKVDPEAIRITWNAPSQQSAKTTTVAQATWPSRRIHWPHLGAILRHTDRAGG